jgi:4-hydroxybenzoate polyprenyltransferase
MKEGRSYVWNLLEATRIKRVFPVLMVILIPAAYTNNFNLLIFLLGVIAALIYSASSIYNAYKDEDYKLPKYFPQTIILIFAISLVISSFNKILITAALLWIFFGFIYNTLARKIILGDALIAGLTHFVIPLIASSLLVGLSLSSISSSIILFYLLALCIGPVTNLKDIKKDKERKYKTLVNSVKKPKTITIIILNVSFILITLIFVSFEILNFNLFFLFLPLVIQRIIVKKINKDKFKEALGFMRVYLMLSFAILIFILSSDSLAKLISSIIFILYLFTLPKDKK